MADPFIGEVKMTAFNFPPNGWALCNGQLLPINIYQALFSILGTTYGGNGTTNFALPNLQGRVPISFGQGPGLSDYVQGQSGGAAAVALATTQIPVHKHLVGSVNQATTGNPIGNVFAAKARRGVNAYAAAANTAINSGDAIGGGQAHNNLQPLLVVNFIIALQGIFPARN